MSTKREIRQLIPVQPTSDGDGVKIQRIAGFNNSNLSPFLMMDELKSDQRADYVGGFAPHPHRGIETLTYMLKGHFEHKDHMGNIGQLRSGGAQWMAAGQGVIHSEMPIMEDGELHGFQIWINQPTRDKMQPAKYHDFQPETITEHREESMGLLRVIAGDIAVNDKTLQGPLTQTGVSVTIADWQSSPGSKADIALPQQHNAMLYVYKGSVKLGGQVIMQGEFAVLSKGELITLTANDTSGMLLLAGEPIDEPVVHYGPFVMNSIQEIEQAIKDYNAGLFETY